MTTQDVKLIQALAASREFEALGRLAEEMSREWKTSANGGQTEWEYVKSSLMRDGRIEGIRELISKVCSYSQ